MPELLHPGVYVQEVPSEVKTIEGVSTSTAAFIGVAERGPIGKASLVTSFIEYRNRFGGFIENSFLTYSVLNFFENGGNKCYIVRVVGEGAKPASIKLCDRERVRYSDNPISEIYPSIIAEPIIIIKASSPGKWGNNIDIEIQDDPNDIENLFKIIVKYQDDVVETWGGLGMIKGEPNYIESRLGPEQSQYIEVERIESETTASPGVIISGEEPLSALDNVPVLAIDFLPEVGGTTKQIKVQLNKSDNSESIAEDIQDKVRAKKDEADNDRQKKAIEEFKCEFKSQRYCFISGFEGVGSSIDIVVAATGDGEEDIRTLLKLDKNAAGADQAIQKNGEGLEVGSSVSGNEPSVVPGNNKKISFNLNQDGIQTITLTNGLNTGDTIADDIQAKIRDIAPARKNPVNENAYKKIEVSYQAQYDLVFGEIDTEKTRFQFKDGDVTTGINLKGSEYLKLSGHIDLVPGMLKGGRTIKSESSKNDRPIYSLNGIDNGGLILQCSFDDGTNWIDLPEMLISKEESAGEKIALALQRKVRSIDLSGIGGLSDVQKEIINQALSGFESRYIANIKLKSAEVRLTDETGKNVGPISSIEIIPYVNREEDAAITLKLGLTNGGNEQNGAAMLRPQVGEYHLGDHSLGGSVAEVESGVDGAEPKETDYNGNNGIKALDIINDVNLIAIPGMGSKSVVSAGLSYCANRSLQDCFFIADMGSDGKSGSPGFDPSSNPLIDSRDEAINYIKGLPVKNDYGAIYFPWVESSDPIGPGRNPKKLLPPSGYIAGLYAKTDSTRGVWKAPAGKEAKLGGTTLAPLKLATTISDTDQDFLNPKAVNVIRAFPAAGTVIWGTRTLSSDSAWRYIPVRRMAIYLRVSIYNGIQWAVFEPNDESLWASLRLNVNSFMMRLFRDGAFQGSSAKDAFFVKCDSNTTTQDDIDAGVVNILVGFAPLKPAEFVVVKISQKSGQQSV